MSSCLTTSGPSSIRTTSVQSDPAKDGKDGISTPAFLLPSPRSRSHYLLSFFICSVLPHRPTPQCRCHFSAMYGVFSPSHRAGCGREERSRKHVSIAISLSLWSCVNILTSFFHPWKAPPSALALPACGMCPGGMATRDYHWFVTLLSSPLIPTFAFIHFSSPSPSSFSQTSGLSYYTERLFVLPMLSVCKGLFAATYTIQQ